MVGKSATVVFGRDVAECNNAFLRHSFFMFLSTQDLKNFVGLSFFKGGGTRNGARGFLRIRVYVEEPFLSDLPKD